MALIHWLQRLAGVVPPVEASLLVLSLTAVAAALIAARRSQPSFHAHRAELAYLVLAPLSMILLRRGAIWLFILMAGVALGALAAVVTRSTGADPDDNQFTPRTLVVGSYLAAASLVAVALLFADLGGYVGRVMIWEYDTSWSLTRALHENQSTIDFVTQRLGWNLGLVSTGDDALLFGTGVHLVWKLLPVSATTLRLPAALLAVACLPAAWLAGRKCLGPTPAAATVVALAVTPALVYYGRYGTSLSGSLLAVLLALAACCAVVCRSGARWWVGLAAGTALFIATLGYAPARLTVVGLLAAVFLLALIHHRTHPRRMLAVAVLAAVVMSAWLFQYRLGRTFMFVNVRGEQVLTMVSQSGWLEDFLGLEVSPDELDWPGRFAVAGRLLENTVPQTGLTLITPLIDDQPPDDVLHADPPILPLYQPWALVFGLWGLAISCRRLTRAPHMLLVAAFGASILPVLFTTRVDAHRLFMVVAPVAIWTGMGVAAALATARSLRLPKALLHGCGVATMILAAAYGASLLYYPVRPVHPTAQLVMEGAARAGAPVVVIAQLDFQDLGSVVLGAAELQRRDPSRAPRVVDRDLALALSDEVGPSDDHLPILVSAARRGAAMLVPDSSFNQLAELARTHGLAIERRVQGDLSFWWVTAPE